MVVKEFSALNFRNYRELNIAFSGGINLVTGGNGQGKTNLAEGIYFLNHLSSFRSGRLEPLLAFGEPAAYLQGALRRADGTHKARVEITRGGRRAWLDEESVGTLSAYVALFYALLFNPDSLYNYRHYPGERRTLFDRFLSFLDGSYLERLRAFRSVHAQKNGLLKSGQTGSLPDWNQLFIDKAWGIIGSRAELTERINERLAPVFQELTGRPEALRLSYQPSLKGDREADAATLERATDSERQAGHALYGPHRDDFQLVLGSQRKESYFSQGEYRIALLALKFRLNALLQERLGFHPVIILDDLFSELDDSVQERLVAHLQSIPNQIFITTTQSPQALRMPGVHIMEIRDGRII